MSFMYLKLSKTDNGIVASVATDGKMPSSVGTANSRWSRCPFAVFAIDSFNGIEAIDTRELMKEIERRLTPEQLRSRFVGQMTSQELVTALGERLGR